MAKHRNAKLIIELSAKNMSRREIARTRHISTHTIKEVLDRASEKGVGWGDVSLLGDDEIAAMLFPEERGRRRPWRGRTTDTSTASCAKSAST